MGCYLIFNCKKVFICFYFFTSFSLISCAVIYILTVKLSKYSLIFEHFQAGSFCSYFFFTLKMFQICCYCFISFSIVICAFNQFLAAKYSKYVLIFSPFSTSFLLFFWSNFKTISAQFLVQLFVLFPQDVLNLPWFIYQFQPFSFCSYFLFSLKMSQIRVYFFATFNLSLSLSLELFAFSLKMFQICSYCFISFSIVICAFI